MRALLLPPHTLGRSRVRKVATKNLTWSPGKMYLSSRSASCCLVPGDTSTSRPLPWASTVARSIVRACAVTKTCTRSGRAVRRLVKLPALSHHCPQASAADHALPCLPTMPRPLPVQDCHQPSSNTGKKG